MKFSTPVRIATVCATLALTGCVVAPVGMEPGYGGHGHGHGGGPGPGPGYGPQPGVVYVAPTYAMPGPGYAWQFHGRLGWGWHHPGRGWHHGRR